MRVIAGRTTLLLAALASACSKPAQEPRVIVLSPQTTHAPSPSEKPIAFPTFDWRHTVRAGALAEAYQKNPIAGDRDFKGQVFEILGLVDGIRRDADGAVTVRLRADRVRADHSGSRLVQMYDDRRRWIPCRFSADVVGSVADLEDGELVSIRGRVLGEDPGFTVPSVGEASIAWAGERPNLAGQPDVRHRNAEIAGRSQMACLTPPSTPGEEALPPVAENATELAKLGGPLPCRHPLMLLAGVCQDVADFDAGRRSLLSRSRQELTATPDMVAMFGSMASNGMGDLWSSQAQQREKVVVAECTPEVTRAMAAFSEVVQKNVARGGATAKGK